MEDVYTQRLRFMGVGCNKYVNNLKRENRKDFSI